MAEKLAILGGTPAISKDTKFKVWPEITKLHEEYVLASLRQPTHSWGPNCVALQDEFAAWNGNKFCATTNSGTAALHMGVAACGIGAGDEVITTTLSWTSSATCILHHNAIPVFVDVDWNSMLIDPSKIEAAITRKTKAILVVDMWSVPCDLDAIMKIAKKHNLYVIEDACQAHGSMYKGRKTGTQAHCAGFSLNQNKNMCGGEGGLFVTDDEQMYETARALMSFGEMRAPEEKRDFHSYGMGWMYRNSDLPAAFARAALKLLDETNAQARHNFERITDGLTGIPGLITSFDTSDQRGNGYQYIVKIDGESVGHTDDKRQFLEALTKALQAEGVEAQLPRWILPAHTVFQAKNGYGGGCPWDCHLAEPVDYSLDQFPVTVDLTNSYFALPINQHRPPNSDPEIDALIGGIRKAFEQLDKVPM